MIFDDTYISGKWRKLYETDEAEFKILPLKCSQHVIRPDASSQQKILFDQAMVYLADWKNLFDVNGNPIPYNEDNKSKILDLRPDLALKICNAAADLSCEIVSISVEKKKT